LQAVVALAVVVALTVVAAAEAGFGEDAIFHAAVATEFDFGFEGIDFVRDVGSGRHVLITC